MHRHWHHGGGQVLQVTSQCLAQGVHVQGLQVTQGPICQGTDFPWEVDTALCTQLAALVLPTPIPESITHQPAIMGHSTTRELRQPSGSPCDRGCLEVHPRNQLALGTPAVPLGDGRGHFVYPQSLP